jgi:nucleoside-diphosphate-sugar epimerase
MAPAGPASNGTTPTPVRAVLVVGGAGYIGSALVRNLLADGYRVRVLDSFQYGDASIRGLYQNPAFEVIRGDFRCIEPVVRATAQVDAVIHLGGVCGEAACALDEELTLETNLAATSVLAEACRGAGVSRLLYASTCEVYGTGRNIADETTAPDPQSLYAATKADSEKILLAARGSGLHPAIFRLAGVFGWSHRPRFDLTPNRLAAQAVVHRRMAISDGEEWLPFVHIEDACRALRMALVAPIDLINGEIFNVGDSAMNLTPGQVAEAIAASEPGVKIETVGGGSGLSRRVSFEKIRRSLGFRCHIALGAGIQGVRQALRRGLIADYRDSAYSNHMTLATHLTRQKNAGPAERDLTAPRFSKNSPWWEPVSLRATGMQSEASAGPEDSGRVAAG